ncbi:MAG: hypothetical protein WD775_15895 [Burkholderiales bacterium]
MKRQALAIVAASLFALPALAMPPEDANYAPTVPAAADKALATAQLAAVAILKTESVRL